MVTYYPKSVIRLLRANTLRLQWNPIAHSKQQDICSKIKDVIIITLMTDLGL